MTQQNLILRHLLNGGTLTPLQALELFGCLSLSQRCGELRRAGHPVRSKIIETPSGKHIAQYSYCFEEEAIPYG